MNPTKEIVITNTFKKDYKKLKSNPAFNKRKAFYEAGLNILANGGTLPAEYSNHPMRASGVKYQGY